MFDREHYEHIVQKNTTEIDNTVVFCCREYFGVWSGRLTGNHDYNRRNASVARDGRIHSDKPSLGLGYSQFHLASPAAPSAHMSTRGPMVTPSYLIRPISRSFSTTFPIIPKYGLAVDKSRILSIWSRTISIVTGSAGSN